jgi:signal transduction histidine kinase/DNA-binding response OmpR family regulator
MAGTTLPRVAAGATDVVAAEAVGAAAGISRRAGALFGRHAREVARRTDRMFAVLMVIQWIAAVLLACYVSPRAWDGPRSVVHPHVWAAIFLGAAISSLPIFLAIRWPGRQRTRHVIAVAQILFSALLIHVSGGRIETHFHVFGSLAFLAVYRDWRVFIPATLVVVFDHLLRGMFWPESVYGVLTATPWRTMEHGVWVLFEDVVLTLSCLRQVREMHAMALRQAELEASKRSLQSVARELRATQAGLERRVADRTSEIAHRNAELAAAHEALKRARDAAESANSAKSIFLANMSHEIRTPMTAIVGYADLLLDPTLGNSDRLNYVQTIRRNGDHLLTLINDILDISKIESGRLDLERIECSPARIVGEVASLMRVKAVERGIDFVVEFAGPIPQHINSDPTRLRQILLNLVSNAVKFTARGHVRIVTRFDATPDGQGKIIFEVHDSGVGMTAEQTARLFEAFAQADATTTRRFGGTGLGLAISKRLAEMLGGTIHVRSAPGKGSVFTLVADIGSIEGMQMLADPSEAILQPPPDQLAPAPASLSARILLAEDGPDNQRLISLILRKAGAHVIVVENGLRVLEAVNDAARQGVQFDVILMDMQMPGLDGYGATSKLRARGYTGPIVALTAHAMNSDRDKCLSAGCNDFLTKPVNRELLMRTVARYLPESKDRRSAASAPPPLVSRFRDDPDIQQILPDYIASLPQRAKQLSEFLRKQSLDELRRVVHQLKGTGGGYGFDEITDRAAVAERRIAAAEPIEQIAREIEELTLLIKRVEGYGDGGGESDGQGKKELAS